MYLYIPTVIACFVAVAVIILLLRFHHLPVQRIIQAAQDEAVMTALDIEISTWYGRSSVCFSLNPKEKPPPDVLSGSDHLPQHQRPMISPDCDSCHEFLLIEPPRFSGKLKIREARYLWLWQGDEWIRYEKIPVYAPCNGHVMYPVHPSRGRKHWWFDIVTVGDILFTVVSSQGEAHEVRADGLYNVYSFQVESDDDKSPTAVLAGDVIMVIAKESPESKPSA